MVHVMLGDHVKTRAVSFRVHTYRKDSFLRIQPDGSTCYTRDGAEPGTRFTFYDCRTRSFLTQPPVNGSVVVLYCPALHRAVACAPGTWCSGDIAFGEPLILGATVVRSEMMWQIHTDENSGAVVLRSLHNHRYLCKDSLTKRITVDRSKPFSWESFFLVDGFPILVSIPAAARNALLAGAAPRYLDPRWPAHVQHLHNQAAAAAAAAAVSMPLVNLQPQVALAAPGLQPGFIQNHLAAAHIPIVQPGQVGVVQHVVPHQQAIVQNLGLQAAFAQPAAAVLHPAVPGAVAMVNHGHLAAQPWVGTPVMVPGVQGVGAPVRWF